MTAGAVPFLFSVKLLAKAGDGWSPFLFSVKLLAKAV